MTTIKGTFKANTRSKKGRGGRQGGTMHVALKKKLGLNKRIRRVVTAMDEKKEANYTARSPFGGMNYTGALSANVIPLTPYATFMDVAQGVGQANRVGNKIRVKRLLFKGIMWPLFYDITTNPTPRPLEIRMWFFSPRNALAAPTSYADFFQNGNSSQGFSNNITDLQKYINEDRYIYRGHRTYKLGYANYQGTGSNAVPQYQANNDFKMNQRFTIDITNMVGKIFQWQDGATANLSNKSVFVVFEAMYADGVGTATTDLLATIDYSLQLTFTDD